MEVDAQLLVGAAITVFLALLFFGVVVLWDVALALRSVGDKIDKLEDNVDDDLMDIAHSLENISNAPSGGGGGGTQLHLSGGTISSGPTQGSAQEQPTRTAGGHAAGGEQPAQGPQQSPQYGPQQATQHDARRPPADGVKRAQQPGPDTAAGNMDRATEPTQPGTATDASDTNPGADAASETADADPAPHTPAESADHDGAATVDGADAVPTGTESGAADEIDAEMADAGLEQSSNVDTDPAEPGSESAVPDAESTADTAESAAAHTESATTDAESRATTAPAESIHPRAERNRGRFITSPDRTAWYAITLDWGAIRDAQPVIAGELTDGSDDGIDESEVIAAGPVDSGDIDDTAGSTAERVGTEPDDSSESADQAVVSGAADKTPTADTPDGSTDEPAPVESDGVPEEDSIDVDADDGATSAGGSAEADDPSVGTDEVFGFDEAEPAADSESHASVSRSTDGVDAESTETATDEREQSPADVERGLESVDEASGNTTETDSDDGATDDDSGAGKDEQTTVEESTTEDPLGGDITAFEFDDGDDLEDDVSVEEAVDTLNEDAPAPELSSHKFDVSAEVYGSDADKGNDGEGDEDARSDESAVLTFEFDTDTVDIGGSTKRLLQYQMQSFADKDGTPDADVSIGRDRIVIEIADTDGNAVQRWGEAAVDIIDRTLYLSDNSSDDS